MALRAGISESRGSRPARSIGFTPSSVPSGEPASLARAAAGRRYPAAPRGHFACGDSGATHAKRDHQCPGTYSSAAPVPGFPGPLAGHSRSQEERDYRGHGAGARGEVRAASVVLLPCIPSSVAVARGRIAAELREAGLFPAAVGDAALVTSELLSNAILHARPLPDARIRVSWILTPTSVEVIVSDGGSATRPHASRPSLSSIGGRGLGIVEHLCSSWGVRADERGTTVWAVLPAARGGGAGPGSGGRGGSAAGGLGEAAVGLDGAAAGAAARHPDGVSPRANAGARTA